VVKQGVDELEVRVINVGVPVVFTPLVEVFLIIALDEGV